MDVEAVWEATTAWFEKCGCRSTGLQCGPVSPRVAVLAQRKKRYPGDSEELHRKIEQTETRIGRGLFVLRTRLSLPEKSQAPVPDRFSDDTLELFTCQTFRRFPTTLCHNDAAAEKVKRQRFCGNGDGRRIVRSVAAMPVTLGCFLPFCGGTQRLLRPTDATLNSPVYGDSVKPFPADFGESYASLPHNLRPI